MGCCLLLKFEITLYPITSNFILISSSSGAELTPLAEAAALHGVHSADASHGHRDVSDKLQKEEVNVLRDTSRAHTAGLNVPLPSYCWAEEHDVKGNCIANDGAQKMPAVTEMERRLEKFDALVKWVEKNGGFMRYHSFRYTPQAGMGVIAGKDIKVV